MRLINEQTAYDVLTDYYHHSTDTQHAALREALGRVESVDVVHCRDCWRYQTANCFMHIERLWELKPTDFCSQGEREDSDGNT